MLLAELVAAAESAAATRSRRAKVDLLAGVIAGLDDSEIEPAVATLCGTPRQGRIGVGWAGVADLAGRAATPELSVAMLDDALAAIAAESGEGSQGRRRGLLDDLEARSTPAEADFVRRLLTGELRHGALAGITEQAVARAFGVEAAALRRAAMLSGDLPAMAHLAAIAGDAALAEVGLQVGTAIQPMLASGAADVADAIAATGAASVEWKLDGARVQAHRSGPVVRLFSRSLHDVTEDLPAVAAEVAAATIDTAILDGEVLYGDEAHPAQAGWFDVLHLDGVDLLDEPLDRRLDALAAIEGLRRIPGTRTDDPAVAGRVLAEALDRGHEGVVVKSLDAPYAAGRRGASWRKIKPVHTLDLIVLAVEWGSGRREGWLSNLHLGARGADGRPVMVGKTFKGLTDELLEWQTARFLELEDHREDHVVFVRPVQVVEIALDSAHPTTRYPGGVAMRFARVRRYRDDKTPADADTLDSVRALVPTGRPTLEAEPRR